METNGYVEKPAAEVTADRERRHQMTMAVLKLKMPPVGSKWRHRNGTVYRVVGGGVAEDTLAPLVGYCDDAVADPRPWDVWYRHLSLFTDGRFTRVDAAPFDGSTWDGVTPRGHKSTEHIPNAGGQT
jgi:hypothetical protein